MGWFIALPLFIISCFTKNDVGLITSGLFAIAGAITFSSVIGKNNKK